MGKLHRRQKRKKSKRKKRKKKKPNPKRSKGKALYRPKHVLQHGWAGVGLPHHTPLPTERWQKADIGQINALGFFFLHKSSTLYPARGSGMKRMPAGERRNVTHLSYTWPRGQWLQCHRASARFRAHIQLQNLGAVAVAHQLRVCYPENADPGGFFVCFCTARCTFSVAVMLSSAYSNSRPYPLTSCCVMRNVN